MAGALGGDPDPIMIAGGEHTVALSWGNRLLEYDTGGPISKRQDMLCWARQMPSSTYSALARPEGPIGRRISGLGKDVSQEQRSCLQRHSASKVSSKQRLVESVVAQAPSPARARAQSR